MILFSSLFIVLKFQAQDVIVKMDGSRVICKILKEDSLSLRYLLPNTFQELEIRLKEVEKYTITKQVQVPVIETKQATFKKPPVNKRDLLWIHACTGIASPLGDFGSKDINKATAGLANSGYLFNLGITLKLSDNIGLYAAYRYQAHTFANDVLNDALTSAYPGVKFTTNSSNWIFSGYFGGVKFAVPVKPAKDLTLLVEASAGFTKYQMPQISSTGVYMGNSSTSVQNEAIDNAPAYVLGTGLMYKMTDIMAFHFGVHHFSGEARFVDVLTTGTGGYRALSNYTQKVASFNIEAGITILIQ